MATKGGNRSWSGHVKAIDTGRFDYLFVLVADGRRWFIPAESIEAKARCWSAVRNTLPSAFGPDSPTMGERGFEPL
ncbi:MAG: hypothetical protein JSU06_00965 [Actinobacteria bacterium]|nr:hypothetical protein [Actinomycetota bacterium]